MALQVDPSAAAPVEDAPVPMEGGDSPPNVATFSGKGNGPLSNGDGNGSLNGNETASNGNGNGSSNGNGFPMVMDQMVEKLAAAPVDPANPIGQTEIVPEKTTRLLSPKAGQIFKVGMMQLEQLAEKVSADAICN
jgi:hypothetical protein